MNPGGPQQHPCPLCSNVQADTLGVKEGYPVVRCRNCDLYYLQPMPGSEELAAIYDDYDSTEMYLRKYRKKILTATYKQKLVGRYLGSGPKRFLDIGCNVGAVCEAARRQGFESTGIDLDEPTLQKARELSPGCRFECMTSYELAERGEKFDLVFCTEVLEHVPETHEFAASFRDLLNDRGVLYLTTPDAGHRRVPADFISWDEVKPPQHLIFYGRDTVTRLLEAHGFEIIRFRWCHRANLRVIARAV
ncbi:MAG: class I SAM-dependent methyltransferase [Xanthomonadales bacterium]|nr:class I SAM-dependent methyltransferase [Gammaproteobacteria bacterium]NNJ64037.1 class I SAM-dependent methyltransferase [Xanthomonadales bacterium]